MTAFDPKRIVRTNYRSGIDRAKIHKLVAANNRASALSDPAQSWVDSTISTLAFRVFGTHTGHPYQQRAISAKESKTGWYPPQSDVELMTQKQILGFKPAPRLEQVDDE